MTPGLDAGDGPAVLRPLLTGRAWLRQHERQRVGERVVAELADCPAVASAGPWDAVPTIGDTVVLRSAAVTTSPLGEPSAGAAMRARVVKVALSAAADAGLRRHERMLGHLACIGACRPLVPAVLAGGWVGAHRFVVEERLDGDALVAAPAAEDTRAALTAIGFVHEASAHERTWEADDVRGWVGNDLARIRRVVRGSKLRATLGAVEQALVEAFTARRLTASVVHGDFWPGNVLVVDGPDRRVSGIVDWERGATSALPERDVVHFLLSSHPQGFASAVRASLAAPDATVGEWVATVGARTTNPSLGRIACTTLTWVAQVGAALAERKRYAPGRLWVRREVVSVLEALGRPGVLASVAANRGCPP